MRILIGIFIGIAISHMSFAEVAKQLDYVLNKAQIIVNEVQK
jgi:hypothetical protein